MKHSKTFLILESRFAHPTIHFVRASSLSTALEVFACAEYCGARKSPDGRWKWGNQRYASVRHLIAYATEVSFEVKQVKLQSTETCMEVFAGIDWFDLMYQWRKFYMNPKRKVGKMYEWHSEELQYYAIFPSPGCIRKKIKSLFEQEA